MTELGEVIESVASKETRECAQCGAAVTRFRSQFRTDAPAFCNKACQGAYKSAHGTGANAAHWQGGATTNHAYMKVYAPWSDAANERGYAYLHILVWRLAYGRLPMPGYILHHRDGDVTNNHPGNLEEMTQAEHVRLHLPRKGTGRATI